MKKVLYLILGFSASVTFFVWLTYGYMNNLFYADEAKAEELTKSKVEVDTEMESIVVNEQGKEKNYFTGAMSTSNLHLFVGNSDEVIVYADGQEKKVKEVIARQHKYVRGLFSKGTEKVDMQQIIKTEEFDLLYNELAFIVDEGLDDSKARNDVMRAVDFMRLLVLDKNAHVYLEKILNDLDVQLNGEPADLFGVTEAYGNGYKELEKYLRGE
ncbi:MAG: hypothetical protein ACQEV7_16055 [Bacillota bacterium]